MEKYSSALGQIVIVLLVLGCSLASGFICFLIGRMIKTVIQWENQSTLSRSWLLRWVFRRSPVFPWERFSSYSISVLFLHISLLRGWAWPMPAPTVLSSDTLQTAAYRYIPYRYRLFSPWIFCITRIQWSICLLVHLFVWGYAAIHPLSEVVCHSYIWRTPYYSAPTGVFSPGPDCLRVTLRKGVHVVVCCSALQRWGNRLGSARDGGRKRASRSGRPDVRPKAAGGFCLRE